MKTNLSIEIVASTQSGLSPMGSKAREAVRAVLAKYYSHVTITIVNDLADLEALVERRPDLVFLGMKLVLTDQSLGLRDPAKVWISQYLDEHSIAYTGSNHLAHELEIDKVLAKKRAQAAGLKTAPFYVVSKNHLSIIPDMPINFPVFIKPTNRGGGQGIDSQSVAKNHSELQAKVRSLATELSADSLVEAYLPGREFSVAILKSSETDSEFSVMPIELIAPPDNNGSRLLSAEVKTADSELGIKVTDDTLKSKVCELAIDVFYSLGARDYGRIDIRLDESGTPYFLEANLMPSLKRSDGNYFPKACALNLDLNYEEAILSIVRLGLVRNHNTEEVVTEPSGLDILPAFEPAF